MQAKKDWQTIYNVLEENKELDKATISQLNTFYDEYDVENPPTFCIMFLNQVVGIYPKKSYMEDNGKLTLESFLFAKFLYEQLPGFTMKRYFSAVSVSIDRHTIMLKRCIYEIRINNYNPWILQFWRANTDIQYILDPYACIVYIMDYIMKGNKE